MKRVWARLVLGLAVGGFLSTALAAQEPVVAEAPTFFVEIPPDIVLCGRIRNDARTHAIDTRLREELVVKNTIRLRAGTHPLPTDAESFAGNIVEEVVFGPQQEIARALGDGEFLVVSVPQLEQSTVYRFTYRQSFALSADRILEVQVASPLTFTGKDGETFPFDERELTARCMGRQWFAGSLLEKGEVTAGIVYDPCTYSVFPRWNVIAELADGTRVQIDERRDAFGLFCTQPVGLIRAEVDFAGTVREVTAYRDLVYAAFRDNLSILYWILFADPVSLPGVEGAIHGVELKGLHDPTTTLEREFVATYLDAALNRLQTQQVTHYESELTGTAFVRGHLTREARTGIPGIILLLRVLFHGETIRCMKSADANDDGRVNLLDVYTLINRLFRDGPRDLPPPSLHCGDDPTPDNLGCEEPACFFLPEYKHPARGS